jgi:predicted phage gp36 major capsid-like protein
VLWALVLPSTMMSPPVCVTVVVPPEASLVMSRSTTTREPSAIEKSRASCNWLARGNEPPPESLSVPASTRTTPLTGFTPWSTAVPDSLL